MVLFIKCQKLHFSDYNYFYSLIMIIVVLLNNKVSRKMDQSYFFLAHNLGILFSIAVTIIIIFPLVFSIVIIISLIFRVHMQNTQCTPFIIVFNISS